MPWQEAASAAEAVRAAKAEGRIVIAVEQTSTGVTQEAQAVAGPLCLVFGAEREGVGQAIVETVDFAITIPMEGMVNSISCGLEGSDRSLSAVGTVAAHPGQYTKGVT